MCKKDTFVRLRLRCLVTVCFQAPCTNSLIVIITIIIIYHYYEYNTLTSALPLHKTSIHNTQLVQSTNFVTITQVNTCGFYLVQHNRLIIKKDESPIFIHRILKIIFEEVTTLLTIQSIEYTYLLQFLVILNISKQYTPFLVSSTQSKT